MSGQAQGRQSILRQLPSVDALLNTPESIQLSQRYGRPLTLQALRSTLETTRNAVLAEELSALPANASLVQSAEALLEKALAPSLYPVINASGVIVHTNLGRAPLSRAAIAATEEVNKGYSNLEYDTLAGKRGSRSLHAAALIRELTGAADGLVVNNNASAVLLMLTALCRDREVIISRGQLVEIGGGFRIPDVMAQSGAHLIEVGTTNRTHLADYERAITPETAAILVAHHSNYQIVGFTSEPALAELAELARRYDILLLFDQGSGALLDVTEFGLDHEVTIFDSLQAGVDLVAFSGDKLVGGPQAGILCGSADLIKQVARHPLARAVRADKTCLAALSTTLEHYLRDEALAEIPIWRMISLSAADIEELAVSWVAKLVNAGIAARAVAGRSRVGGGSLPGSSLPTTLVTIDDPDPEALALKMRTASFPVIGRIHEDRFLLDPRTVLPEQREILLQAVIEVCTSNE